MADLNQIVAFGAFRLHLLRRKLFCGREEVQLGGRAMDILLALARADGEIVSKGALIAAAWPDVFVHEGNLKVTVAHLRRALREHAPANDHVRTVVGRGYWLQLGEDNQESGEASGKPAAEIASLPELGTVIGREEAISDLHDRLTRNRLTTVVGAGGIGKTTVAVAAARRFLAGGGGSVCFVDLSRVANEEYVASSLAAALGVRSGDDGLQAITSILERQRMLLLFDTCEHVLNAVALISDVLLARTRAVRILATSRQTIRAKGEKIVWLSPLTIPPHNHATTAKRVLEYSAPQLLVARAFEKTGYQFVDEDAAAVAHICRRLDGTPLAIELVASRMANKSADSVLDELDDRLLTLKRADSAGPSRQQTLLMTLKWSYALLTEDEAAVLRAVSVFAGAFDTYAIGRVTAHRNLVPIEVFEAVAGLCAKSMLHVDPDPGALCYYLLDSTRAFAGELLSDNAENAAVSGAHAQLQLELLNRANRELTPKSASQWRTTYAGLVDDLRKALDWTLYRSGNPALALQLVAAGLPLWQELSLGEETRRNCERALAEFERIGSSDASLKLKLVVGLASVNTYVSSDREKAIALFRRATDMARQMGDHGAECRVLGALAAYELMPGRGGEILETLDAMRLAADRAREPAAHWEEGQLRVQWEIRVCDFPTALSRAERLLDEMRADADGAVPRFQIHQKMNVEIQLAALNWLMGRPGEAVRIATMAAREAKEIEHGLTLVHCLAQGVVWTFLQCRDYEMARPYVESLGDAIYRHGVAAWIPVVNCYTAVIAAFSGEHPDPELLRNAYKDVREGAIQIRHDARYAMLAEAMLANGQAQDAANVVRDVFAINSRPWGLPEFLRIRAATERALGRDREAEATLVEALRATNAVGCPAWKLRAALDLAKLLRDRASPAAARRVLASVYEQFGDGFDTGDLRHARELLAQLPV